MDLSDLFNPGLYKITCTANQKQYIGESSNVLLRLGRHTDSLQKNQNDCAEMQKDFHKYSKKELVINEAGDRYNFSQTTSNFVKRFRKAYLNME